MSLKQRLVILLLVVLIPILCVAALFWLFTCAFSGSQSRSRKLLLSFDQLLNALFGNDEDEWVSSWLGRTAVPGAPKHVLLLAKFVNWLFFVLYGEVNHCQNKIELQFLTAEQLQQRMK